MGHALMPLLPAAVGLVAAAAYIWLALPRLGRVAGAVGALALAALGIGTAFAAGVPQASVPLTVALVFGEMGWMRGRAARMAAPTVAVDMPPPVVRQEPGGPSSVPAASETPPASTTTPLSSLMPESGTLGRYRIERELGRGAMGAVYLAQDPTLGRPVALKTMALSREFTGDALADARERFFREAEMAGRLRHPDIVTIFDAGEDAELAYLAMEFIDGHDLQRHTEPGRLLPVATVLAVAARVADALAHAHTQGVVHRDIKPANVMIETSTDTVKVTDFGIARVADGSRTRTGMVLGTPSFMSPEQLTGRRVDGRSDLYSLGVMLFQLLTGALPHGGDSMAKLMFQIANEPAPDVRSLRPELPEALANIVALALEKRPETRYADGGELAEDLRVVAALLEPQPGRLPSGDDSDRSAA